MVVTDWNALTGTNSLRTLMPNLCAGHCYSRNLYNTGKLNDLLDSLSWHPTAEVIANANQNYSSMLPSIFSELYAIGDNPLPVYILEAQEYGPLT